ncbi:Dual specificity protein phosphatase Mpk3 [Gryllus bimaculatus]|nr:Dual specificity protein phosphatase Mpk3 [Gryllus bimaculatus]
MMTSWRNKHPVGFLNNGNETTEQLLRETLYNTRVIVKPLPGYASSALNRISVGVDCDEVYPNIFIGDAASARNKAYLKRIGVTHVLNTAEGSAFGMVNTNSAYYKDTGIKYKGIHLLDLPLANISDYFYETADFIEGGVTSGGKVLVHCLMGVSRSSTCVLSYLMIKRKYTAQEALRIVRQNRAVGPNDGFLRQLAELDNKLRRERERSSSSTSARYCQHL